MSASKIVYTEMEIAGYLNARLTSYHDVEAAVSSSGETIVTLVRGGSEAGSISALNAMSAGGEPADQNCGKPTESQAISQVGGSQPGVPQKKLPEFTTRSVNSINWARRGGWFVIKIRAKYLTKGDVGQYGWICLKNAPIESGQFIPHPNPVKGFNLNAD